MRKCFIVTIATLLCLLFTGCGANSVDPSQVITKDKETNIENKSEVSFSYTLNEQPIMVGKEFVEADYPAANSKYEVPSCAFEGTDNVYGYDEVEITTYKENGKEVVYSIYFVEPTAKTEKGIGLGDELSSMLAAYGEGYELTNDAYSYIEGNVKLTFIAEADTIVSIEYFLIVE